MDTHSHGDIMSFYTNDIDTLRQMISQSLPQMMISGVTLLSVFCIMMYYSILLALVVVCGVVLMTFVARYVSSTLLNSSCASRSPSRRRRALWKR